MRRPPDKELLDSASLHKRDIDSSNATLNTLFGGGRQKPWMTGAGNPVRPTPRPSLSNTVLSPCAAVERTNFIALPSARPSNESDPALYRKPPTEGSHEVIDGNENFQARRTADVLNANRAGQEASGEFDARPSNLSNVRNGSSQCSSPRMESLYGSIDERELSGDISYNTQSRAGDLPHLHSSIPVEGHRNEEESPSQLLESPTREVLSDEPESQVLDTSRLSPIPNAASVTVQEEAVNQQPRLQYSVENKLSSNHGQLAEPISIDALLSSVASNIQSPTLPIPLSSQTPNATETFSNIQNQQQQLYGSLPPFGSLLASIEDQIKSVGGVMALNANLERPRYLLLVDACKQNDLFYLIIHQLFVRWDINRYIDIPGLPTAETLTRAFEVIGWILCGNEQLASNHKNWFSLFPFPLQYICHNEPYRKVIPDIGLSLDKLARNWSSQVQVCKTRKYPFLVDELVHDLGILSPILQGVAFVAIRRTLGIRDKDVCARMERLFKKDQSDYQILAARRQSDSAPLAAVYRERNIRLATEYRKLHDQGLQSSLGQTSGSMAACPSAMSSTPVVSTDSPALIGAISSPPKVPQPRGVHQALWQSNVSIPDPTANCQSPYQFQQTMIQRLANSSNSSLSGKSVNDASFNGQANTPSPRLLQGLSMNLPAQQNNPIPSMGSQSQQRQMQRYENAQPSYFASQRPGVVYPVESSHQLFQQPMQPTPARQLQQPPRISTDYYQQLMRSISYQQNMAHLPHQQQQRCHPRITALSMQQNVIPNASAQQLAPRRPSQQGTNQTQIALQGREHIIPTETRHQATSTNNSASNNQSPINITDLAPPPSHSGASSPLTYQPLLAHRTKLDHESYMRTPIKDRLLVPPHDWIHPPEAADPNRPQVNALHQAHLRSPRLVPADFSSPVKIQNEPISRYYQAVKNFALVPSKISNPNKSTFHFIIPDTDFVKIAPDTKSKDGTVPTRNFKRGTLQYRIRCVQVKNSEISTPYSEWVKKDTRWPEYSCLQINKNQLEMRRKTHHGKDLPIDITQHVANHGAMMPNQIIFSCTRPFNDNYYIAVEVIEILHHQQILEICKKNQLPASHTLESIQKSFGESPADGDEDLTIGGDISIDLADPFTARVFDIPVRGVDCPHRECFDLETFLFTRNSKNKRPFQPCMIDVWKCPLCHGDVRPWCLQIDGFFSLVRRELAEQKNLDVKAILVGPDGQWYPKGEKRKAAADLNETDNSSDGIVSPHRKAKQKKVIEIISLDD